MYRIGELAQQTGVSRDALRFYEREGLSLADIRSLLGVMQKSQPPCANVRGLLRQKVELLNRRIAELTALRDSLAERLAWAETHPDPACDGQDRCVYLDSTPA